MRIQLAIAALLGTASACASKPAPVSTSPLSQCPFKVLATVGNSGSRSYDVYYYEGSKRSILGEIAGGSTMTYQLPGEGRGSVRLFASQSDGGGRPNERTTRIRIHCAGS